MDRVSGDTTPWCHHNVVKPCCDAFTLTVRPTMVASSGRSRFGGGDASARAPCCIPEGKSSRLLAAFTTTLSSLSSAFFRLADETQLSSVLAPRLTATGPRSALLGGASAMLGGWACWAARDAEMSQSSHLSAWCCRRRSTRAMQSRAQVHCTLNYASNAPGIPHSSHTGCRGLHCRGPRCRATCQVSLRAFSSRHLCGPYSRLRCPCAPQNNVWERQNTSHNIARGVGPWNCAMACTVRRISNAGCRGLWAHWLQREARLLRLHMGQFFVHFDHKFAQLFRRHAICRKLRKWGLAHVGCNNWHGQR